MHFVYGINIDNANIRTVGRGETKVRQKSFWAILDFCFLSCPVERQHFEEYFSKIFHSDMFIKVVNFLLEIAKCDILRVSAYMMTKLKKQVIHLIFSCMNLKLLPQNPDILFFHV